MLREQLTQKAKIGGVYKPDFVDGARHEEAMVTQKFLKDALMEQQARFEEERRALEKRYQAQLAQQQQRADELEKQLRAARAEAERLQRLLDDQGRDFEGLKEGL